MFTTGSKLFIGATTLSLAATIVVGSTTSGGTGSLATIGLISLTVALAFLTGIVVFVRGGIRPMAPEGAVEFHTVEWPDGPDKEDISRKKLGTACVLN
jgi:hypothetical protein